MVSEKYKMTWAEVYSRIENSIPKGKKCFGIPRGGFFVAAATGNAVGTPEEAEILVDDLTDSGRTRKYWKEKYPNKPFHVLLDKEKEGLKGHWIIFPWETDEETGGTGGPTDAVVRLLQWIGENPTRDGLIDTPARVVKAWQEMTAGYHEDPEEILGKSFEVDHDEMIALKGIRFTSLCEHHVLPFSGICAVGYLPKKRVVGISKLARVVQTFAKRLQIQERLTQEIAEAIQKHVDTEGVGVVIKATHSCMACRGALQPDAEMVTSCLLGEMRDSPVARQELLYLLDINR